MQIPLGLHVITFYSYLIQPRFAAARANKTISKSVSGMNNKKNLSLPLNVSQAPEKNIS